MDKLRCDVLALTSQHGRKRGKMPVYIKLSSKIKSKQVFSLIISSVANILLSKVCYKLNLLVLASANFLANAN